MLIFFFCTPSVTLYIYVFFLIILSKTQKILQTRFSTEKMEAATGGPLAFAPLVRVSLCVVYIRLWLKVGASHT